MCMVCADNTNCDVAGGLASLTDVATAAVYAAVNAVDATATGTVNLAASGT